MASSFDEVSHEDEAYRSVMALYAAIKDTPGILRVRRAEMRQGEVQADPIDFVIDVELKAKRALQHDPMGKVEWTEILKEPDQYLLASEFTRKVLGHAFLSTRLDVGGDYKKLYWRIKNNQQRTTKEAPSGIFE